MLQADVTKSVNKYLNLKVLKYTRYHNEECYGAVMSVITPNKNEVSVKVFQKFIIWKIEDRYWPSSATPKHISCNYYHDYR